MKSILNLTLGAIALSATHGSAKEPASVVSTPPLANPWEVTAAAGLSYADGNSESLAYSLQLLASYFANGNEIYLGADYFYSEQDQLASTDNLKLYGQYNRDITDRFYVGAFGSYFTDDIADIDYRIDTSLVLGYRLIKTDRVSLALEVGPGYTWEEQSALDRSYATLRAAERFEFQINKYSKIWQSISWIPEIEDFNNYLVDFEIGLETRLTRHFSLRTFYRNRIDGSPAAGRERSDSSLMVGIAYDIGGLPEPVEAASGGRRSLMPGEEAAADKKTGWISTAGLGFGLNKGNSDSMTATFNWNTAYLSEAREFFFDLAYAYGEDNEVTSTDRVTSRLQYNQYLSDRFYVGAVTQYLRDEPADVDYRITPSLLAGYSLIKTDKTKLAIEAGPSWTFENTGANGEDSYFSLMAAERLTHQLSQRFTVNQFVVWNAEANDTSNYTLNAGVALDAKVGGNLIWRIAGEYLFDNTPAANRKHHDTLVSSSILYRF